MTSAQIEELDDSDGKLHDLPGQMVVNNGYPWPDGIEPVLMQLLDGISLSEIADAFTIYCFCDTII